LVIHVVLTGLRLIVFGYDAIGAAIAIEVVGAGHFYRWHTSS
jgi:hypothetical protein